MAASVQILCPNGHRQTVKVTPNTKILQILEEVCMKKGFMPPEDYELRHGRTTLDVTLSIRFANLVSNAKLELVKSQKSRVETTVVIALQLASGTRLQHAFSPGITLWDILMHWENQSEGEHQGKLAVSNGDEHPVCIYMRDEVIGEEALKSTALRTLGLTGGKAILRLLHRKVEAETLQEISRQLAADKVKQEKLVARSVSVEAMSTEASATSLKGSTVPEESERVDQAANVAGPTATKLTTGTDTIPMDTESVSPVRKQPKLEPHLIMPKLEPEEPMEEEIEEGTSLQSNLQSDTSEASRHLDELSRIPGVQVFRPGEPVRLSAEQQELVNSLAQEIQPHIIQPQRPQSGQSAKPRCPQQPPVPFKFPKTTKSEDLYRNEPSETIANKEDYAPCDRETVVYSHGDSVKHEPDYSAELSDDFFEVTVKDLKRMMADRAKALESFDEQPLMTKAMRQAAQEEKFSKYKRVVIRVQFPDKMVIQGLFRPKETVYAVEKFVKEHLEDKSMAFYLYMAPPKCVIKDKSSTLIEAKLAPATLVYFGSDSKKGKYLSAAIAKECSSKLDADKVVLMSLFGNSSGDHERNHIKVKSELALDMTCADIGDDSDESDYEDEECSNTKAANRRPKRNISCKVCDKTFTRKDNLRRHERLHGEKLLQCDECPMVYHHKHYLEAHKRRAHYGIVHSCTLCDKKYKMKEALKKHLESHEGKFRYKCDECGQGFSYQTNYDAHMDRHKGIKRHKCRNCGKGFTLRSDKDRHFMICASLSIEACSVCGKTFKNPRYLKEHEKIHKDPAAFKCQFCDKLHNFAASLRKHITTKHKFEEVKTVVDLTDETSEPFNVV